MAKQVSAPKHRGGPTARSRRASQRGRHISTYSAGFGRFASITTLSLVPGAGLLAVGRRAFGLLLVMLTALALLIGVAFAYTGDVVSTALSVAVSPSRLLTVAGLAVLVGLIWCLSIITTAWHARPERPTAFQAALGLILVLSLCAVVAAPSAKGVQLALVQRDLVTSVFSNGTSAPPVNGAATPETKADDPWESTPRMNLLLLGSDSGADRTGVRTDSMVVVSIDTKTGNAVLIGLPRNLENVPFPVSNPLHNRWPNGFNCGGECLLNAVWTEAVQHKNLFKGNPNPGLTTTRDVIGEVTGLRIDNYVTVDIDGFRSLIDAMGGVVVTVHQKLPIGGGTVSATNKTPRPITGWIYPGKQRLNGEKATWFARSRHSTDDYDRMRRQRCLIGDLVDQVNPVRMLSNYADLATVFKNNISTDIKQDQLQAWVVLAERMKSGSITSLPFTRNVIQTSNPDFPMIREDVQRALSTKSQIPSTGSSTTTPGSTPTGTKSPDSTFTHLGSTDSKDAQDLSEVC